MQTKNKKPLFWNFDVRGYCVCSENTLAELMLEAKNLASAIAKNNSEMLFFTTHSYIYH